MLFRATRVRLFPPRPPGWPEHLPNPGNQDGHALVAMRRAVTADDFRCMTARKLQNALILRPPFRTTQPTTIESSETGGPADAAPGPLVQLKGWFGHPSKAAVRRDRSFFEQHLAHIVPFELYLGTGDAAALAAQNLVAFLEWIKTTPNHCDLVPLLEQHLDVEELRKGVVTTEFVRFDAPLALLLAAVRFNSNRHGEKRLSHLYIAQVPLSDMPQDVQLNVPTPECLASADVYNTSLWLGLEPTFTPWHRDPNPNLFYQIYGNKEIRLMEPARAMKLFKDVMQSLGKPSTPNLRGNEIMQGPERQAFVDAVWSPYTRRKMHEMKLFHLLVQPGDVVFIPKGWWHSVRSVATGGRGTWNASVNWWFRWRASAMSDVVAPDSSEQNSQSSDQPSSGGLPSDPDPKPSEAHSAPPDSSQQNPQSPDLPSSGGHPTDPNPKPSEAHSPPPGSPTE